MFSANRISAIALLCAIMIQFSTAAHARRKVAENANSSESTDLCSMTDEDLAQAKERHAKALDYAKDEISKCCNEVCHFSFTANQIDLLTILAALVPNSVGLKESPSFTARLFSFLGSAAIGVLGWYAKTYASREIVCTDAIKDKKLSQLRIISDTIMKMSKKEAKVLCEDMKKVGNGAKNRQEQLDVIVKILKAQGKYPEFLDELHSDCDQVSLEKARSIGCVSAVYRYCIGQGARGGIAQEVPTHSIQAVCLPRDTSVIENVGWEKIGDNSKPNWIKRKTTPSTHQSSVNTICQDKGHDTGAIQEYLSNSVDILCIKTPGLRTIAFSILTQKNPRCDSIQNITHPFCTSAVHSYCVSSGYAGGLLHQQNADGSIVVACFAGRVHNIEFSDRVPAYH